MYPAADSLTSVLAAADTSSSPGLGSHGSRLSGAVTQTETPLGAFLSPDLFGARPVHLDLAGISASLPQSLSAAALLGPQDGLHGMATDDLYVTGDISDLVFYFC
jgi:hypothetical protein